MSTRHWAFVALFSVGCGRDEAASTDAAPGIEITSSAPGPVDEGATVTLSGTVASAPGEALAYEWKQVAGPKTELATPFAAATTLRAPDAIADYELSFELSVTRGAQVASRRVDVRVRADDDPPEVEAHGPERAECGERVVVTGQGRSAEPQRLRFDWRQIGDGPRILLEEGGGSQASFIAPTFSGQYTLWLEFTVSDGVHPPLGARVQVPIDCDARTSALPPGKTRKLKAEPGVASNLVRGSWLVSGAIELEPEDPERAATATLRFEYGAQAAAAVALTRTGERSELRMFGLVRDAADAPWREPNVSGSRALGEWPADQPLGFEFDWDGRELFVHWGPPGVRESWPELPFPVSFPLASRPKAVVIEVQGGVARVADFLLTGR